jgi:hypothetical protein
VNKSLFNKAERTVAVFASLKLKKIYFAKEKFYKRKKYFHPCGEKIELAFSDSFFLTEKKFFRKRLLLCNA